MLRRFRMFFGVWLAIFCLTGTPAQAQAPDRAADWRAIESHWPALTAHMRDYIHAQNADRSTNALYFMEVWTYDLFMATIAERKTDLRDGLMDLYDSLFDRLQTVNSYKYYNDPRSWGARISDHPLPKPARVWLRGDGLESTLHSSQFLFMAMAGSRHMLATPPVDDRAKAFATRAVPVVVEHLKRWVKEDRIFQITGWGCGVGLHNHHEFLKKKLDRAFESPKKISYCNAVLDEDLWMIAMAAELLAAQPSLDENQRLGAEDHATFRAYLHLASDLLKSRSVERDYSKPDGTVVRGMVFDAGAFDDYELNRFGDYTGATCPTSANIGAHQTGWDTSHGTRQPVVFTSLYETRAATGMNWPDENVLAAYGRAFAYGVFDGNFEQPRLRNFLDGSNGWYHMETSKCTGYRPFGLSYGLFYGAWGRYAPYESSVAKITAVARRILTSEAPADVAVRRDLWDHGRMENGELKQDNFATPGVSVWSLPLLSTWFMDNKTKR